MRHRLPSLGTLLIGVLLVVGCATLGPSFQPVDKIPEGMGLIYIYRVPEVAGEALSYDVKVRDMIVTTLRSGGYYPYLVTPGEVQLWARTAARPSSFRHGTPAPERVEVDLLRLTQIEALVKSAVTVDVKAGEVYYVKGEAGVRFFVGRPRLRVVPSEEGKKEIQRCQLIPEPPSQTKR
jgi:hypothetical protein